MINDNLLLPVIADIENEPVPISIEINVTLKVAENMPYIPSSMLIIKLGIYILKQIIDAIINMFNMKTAYFCKNKLVLDSGSESKISIVLFSSSEPIELAPANTPKIIKQIGIIREYASTFNHPAGEAISLMLSMPNTFAISAGYASASSPMESSMAA